MVKIDLIHKTLASGRLMNNSLTGDFLYNTPGWTGTPMYTSPTEVNGIACSGTDVKVIYFHNTDDYCDVNVKTYFYNTGEDNRSLNIDLPYSETAEWDFGYVMHLNSGESIYGNTSPISIYGERNAPLHKTGFYVDILNDQVLLTGLNMGPRGLLHTGHGLMDGDKVHLKTGIHEGTLPDGLATGVGYFVSLSGDGTIDDGYGDGHQNKPYIQFHTDKSHAVSAPPTNAIDLTDIGNDFELYKDHHEVINYTIYGAELLSGTS